MEKQLSKSTIDRQNVLNNKYAIEEMQHAIGIRGIHYENESLFTKSQVARFLEVTERTIDNYIEKYEAELRQNGYNVFTGKTLKDLKIALGNETFFATKTTRIAFFNFRAFLNLTMLLSESDKARVIRQILLDTVIDVINKKSGGSTKYINQREDAYLIAAFQGEKYRKDFTEALKEYVDMGRAKYPIYTNKVYEFVFKEKAQEYRKILRLSKKENVRETMYSEVLDIIASFEAGFAEELSLEYIRQARKLSAEEVDDIFTDYSNKKHWVPLIQKARTVMASRDSHFRNVEHTKLKKYIGTLSPEEFERFLGEKSKELAERVDEYKEVFKRLKDR